MATNTDEFNFIFKNFQSDKLGQFLFNITDKDGQARIEDICRDGYWISKSR